MDHTAVTCLVVIILEAITGFLMNGFIVLVIFCNWLKGEITASVNKILVALSISNMCFAAVSLTCILISVFWPPIHHYGNVVLFWMIMFWLTSCSWLTACLSSFYFIKIVNFSSGFLSWVKVRIDSAAHWLILVSEVVSLCCMFIGFIAVAFYVVQTQGIFTNSSIILSTNRTKAIYAILSLFQRVFVILLLFNLVPFLIMTITTFCTVGFLRMHIYRIQRSIGSSSNLESHHGVVTTMTKLLLFYLFFYVAVFAYPYIYAELPYYSYYIYQILSPAFPLIQFALLIRANPRLKEAWHQIFLYLKRHSEKVIF
uniref:Taste receptor type 2 n=1 Tax=Leptobrachium leishanense TaxID=445787 RepID=A0A8C5QL49_9ANUR